MNNQRYYTICYSRTEQDAKSIHTYLPLFLYALDFPHNSNMTFANFALHPRNKHLNCCCVSRSAAWALATTIWCRMPFHMVSYRHRSLYSRNAPILE